MVLALVGLVLLQPPIPVPAGTVVRRILPGHLPAAVQRAVPIGRLPGSQRLDLAIGLPLRNRENLTNLLQAIYDPSNPRYRRFLTPGQFAEQFGPTTADYEAVIAFAQTNGFKVTRTHGNRVLLNVNASVADIERALHLSLRTYQHPTENRTFYAPDAEPSVEPTLPILDVSGLSDFCPPHPLARASALPSGKGPTPLYGSGPGGTYRGNDFRAAYAPGVAVTGLGQAVGLVEFDGYYASDITSYESQAGLPNVPLANVLLDSFNGAPGSANIEVALDIEVAIAMAPRLSQVIVYEAGPKGIPNDVFNRMATDNQAKQLSSSWAWSGGPNSTTDQIFQQFAAQGQSFFQASGDSGAYTGSINQTSEPSDNPYITVVGGTTLTTSGPGGAWVSEKVWNWNDTGSGTNGSGGGISTTYTIPSWQQGISMSANQGSATMRNIPDVAMTADNIYIVYNNGSSGMVGGTSAAAPLWAGYAALINQQALANGQPLVGFVNPALYSLAKGTNYGAAFHDITVGSNTNLTSTNKFFAVAGYDLCTGWGSPAGSSLISALAGPATPQIVSNSLALAAESCSNGAVDPGETVTLNLGLINLGSANTTNLVATLQASGGVTAPSGPQTYGALVVGGAEVVRPFSFTAGGACGGTLTATLQLQDGSASLGSVTFQVPLGAATSILALSENFDGVSAPALPAGWTSAVVSGARANWVGTNGFSDTSPNSAFADDAPTAGFNVLLSPVIPISSSSAQLTFRHNYDLASHTASRPPRATTYYDGAVLEISIGGQPFADILSAGGSFVAGGYDCTLSSGTGNALAGRQAWGGSSGGWLTTTVGLPAAAAGQNVQLRWGCATGTNTSYTAVGWFVDSISIQDSFYQCCTPSADLAITQAASPSPGAVGKNLSYTLTINNPGPAQASSVTVTDTLPASVTFVSASPGSVNLGGRVAWTIGTLPIGKTTNVVLTVAPTVAGAITNTATVSTTTLDPNSANNTNALAVTVEVPPSITTQPASQVVDLGGSVAFQVGATGTAPLTYQWTCNGTALAGATASSLLMSNVQASQAGIYAALVNNAVGSTTSSTAALTVLVPPTITLQPSNQTVVAGASVSFQAQVSGSAPLSYQWRFNGNNLAGATTNTMTLIGVQAGQTGGYSLLVTNTAGATTSVVATLTVGVPPAITQSPSSLVVTQGQDALFLVGASGSTPLSYQWRFGGANISGATASNYQVLGASAAGAGSYDAVVSNAYGSATSSVAGLTVLVPPTITLQPSNQTVVAGAGVSFQAQVSGSAPLSYQWLFNGNEVAGATTNTLTLTGVQAGQSGGYSLVVTNTAGAITSVVATLTVGVPPAITQSPSSLVVTQGQNAAFVLGVSGSAPLSYQWRFGGANISGATASNYQVPGVNPANAGSYDAVVSNAYGSATSSVAALTVLVPPTITLQPSNQTVVAGASVSFQAQVSGSAPLSYQWLFNGNEVAGATTNTLTLTGVQAGQAGGYSLLVTNTAGAAASVVATLTVGVPPLLSLTNLAVSGNSIAISLSSAAGLTYTLEYKSSLMDSNWTALPPSVLGTGDWIQLQDTNAASFPSRFYRVKCD